MEITQTKTGGILSWGEEDWLAGLQPFFENVTYSINSANLKGFSWSVGIDPFYMPGALYPGRYFTSQTTASVVDAMQRNAITNGDQAYSVAGTKIHNFNAFTGVIANNATFPKSITHGGHSSLVLSDIVKYYVGTVPYAFYSFNDATDADVGTYDLASTFDDDWMSTVPTVGPNLLLDKTNPHPMIVGDDDCLYIGDGRYLDKYDGQTGTNGTFTRSKLNLPLGSVITSYSKIENFLVVYAYKPSLTGTNFYKSEVRAYFWDYVSEDPTYARPIQGNYVNGGFVYKGQPGCFIEGTDPSLKSQRGSKLVIFNGSYFDEVATFPDAIPGHGGVEAMANVIMWNSSGVLYRWGSMFGYPNALNKVTSSTGGATAEGMLKNLSGNKWFISTGTGTSGGAEWTGDGGFYTEPQVKVGQTIPPFPSGHHGRVTKVNVKWRYKYTSSGSKMALTLLYRSVQGTNGTFPVLNHFLVAPNTSLVDEYLYGVPSDTTSNLIFPKFSQIGWQITYTGGTPTDQPDVVERIEIHYENVKS